jgi:hypothetical protein
MTLKAFCQTAKYHVFLSLFALGLHNFTSRSATVFAYMTVVQVNKTACSGQAAEHGLHHTFKCGLRRLLSQKVVSCIANDPAFC